MEAPFALVRLLIEAGLTEATAQKVEAMFECAVDWPLSSDDVADALLRWRDLAIRRSLAGYSVDLNQPLEEPPFDPDSGYMVYWWGKSPN